MAKTTGKGKKKDHTTQIVADMTGYSYEYVRLVRNGERHNEEILATLIDYQQGHSKLVQHLKNLIPLDAKRKRRTLVNSMMLVLAMLLTGCSDLIDMNERSASFYDYSNNLVLRERMLDELFTSKR